MEVMVGEVEDQNQTTLSLGFVILAQLMCGSSAAAELLPLHIVFFSAAQVKNNYSVSESRCLTYLAFTPILGMILLSCFVPLLQ